MLLFYCLLRCNVEWKAFFHFLLELQVNCLQVSMQLIYVSFVTGVIVGSLNVLSWYYPAIWQLMFLIA